MKTFGELSRNEKGELVVAAVVDNRKIEVYLSGVWRPIPGTPLWDNDSAYRIVSIKPSIDWIHVSHQYNWLATDEDGYSYLFTNKPAVYMTGKWMCPNGKFAFAEAFASYIKGYCESADSLVESTRLRLVLSDINSERNLP